MDKKNKIIRLTLLGLMAALLFIMAYTPLGYLNVGPLAITFNVIPIAVAAVAMGPLGGAVTGGIFGLTSFLQCFGGSALGTALFGINPALTVVQCFVPRILDGLITGLAADALASKNTPVPVRCGIAGFLSAFLNTLLYMGGLILLFGNTELIMGYREKLAPGKNVFLFVCAFVGINAAAEMCSSTVITSVLGTALSKARLLPAPANGKKPQFD